MQNVIIFGRNGWLANEFSKLYRVEISKVDITNLSEVANCILNNKPDIVINCAGKTGRPNIDWCVKTESNEKETILVNAVAPVTLSSLCKLSGSKFVHFSSGCLWESGNDIDETIKPNPPSFYSKTKACAENCLSNDDLIIRPRMPFSGSGERCVISKLLKYPKIISHNNSMVYIPDLIAATKHLIDCDAKGIYNVVNKGGITNQEIIDMYNYYKDENHQYEIVSMEYLLRNNLCVEKRSNCTLSIDKLLQTGFNMPDVKTRMIEVLSN